MLKKQEVKRLEKELKNTKFNSIGKLLNNVDDEKINELCLKYLYEYGKNLIYDGNNFVEEEFPLSEFKQYINNLIKLAMKLLKYYGGSKKYIMNIIYIYAISNKYGYDFDTFDSYFDIFLNEFTMKGLKENIDEFDKDVLNDCFEYLLNNDFEYVLNKLYFFNGVYYLENENAMGSKTMKMVEKAKEYIKNKVFPFMHTDILCAIDKMYKEGIGDDLTKYFLNLFYENASSVFFLYLGLFINERNIFDANKKYNIAKSYVDALKERKGIHLVMLCEDGMKDVNEIIIKHICKNYSDLWDDLRKGIKGTKYCNEDWDCCQESIFDVFDI